MKAVSTANWPRATLSLTSSHSADVCSVIAALSTSAFKSFICLQCAWKAISCKRFMYAADERPPCPLRASSVFASSRVMIVDMAVW